MRDVGKILNAHEDDQTHESFDLIRCDWDPVGRMLEEETAGLGVGVGLSGDQGHQALWEQETEKVKGVTALGQLVARSGGRCELADYLVCSVAKSHWYPGISRPPGLIEFLVQIGALVVLMDAQLDVRLVKG